MRYTWVTLEEVSTMPLFSDVQFDGFSYSPLAHLTLLLFGIYCFWGNGPYLSLGLLPLQTQSSFIKSNHILSKHKDIHNAPREKKYWTIKCKSWIRAFSPGETKKKKERDNDNNMYDKFNGRGIAEGHGVLSFNKYLLSSWHRSSKVPAQTVWQ